MNEMNTWGAVWTYLIIALLAVAGPSVAWGLNVYTHWEPNVQQNTRLGLEANALNIEKMDKVYNFAKKLKSTSDLKYADSIIKESSASYRLVTLYDQKAKLDSIAPKVVSHETKYITSTYFRVYWTLDKGSKGNIEWGTVSGSYPNSTVMEEKFLTSHTQTIGTTANPPKLQPATKYFYRIYMEDQYGNKGYSEEYNQTTK